MHCIELLGFQSVGILSLGIQSLCAGSVISNRREPRSSLDWVFNFKLGSFTWQYHKCAACKWPLLKLKTRPRFCLVSWSLSSEWLLVTYLMKKHSKLNHIIFFSLADNKLCRFVNKVTNIIPCCTVQLNPEIIWNENVFFLVEHLLTDCIHQHSYSTYIFSFLLMLMCKHLRFRKHLCVTITNVTDSIVN